MQRIVVVADHPRNVRFSRLALRQATNVQVVATLDGRHPVRSALWRLRPDIILLLGPDHGVYVRARIREIREASPNAWVVLLPERTDAWAPAAEELRADAVMPRDVAAVELGRLLRDAEQARNVRALTGHDTPTARTSA